MLVLSTVCGIGKATGKEGVKHRQQEDAGGDSVERVESGACPQHINERRAGHGWICGMVARDLFEDGGVHLRRKL
jgi:hypothetical protein